MRVRVGTRLFCHTCVPETLLCAWQLDVTGEGKLTRADLRQMVQQEQERWSKSLVVEQQWGKAAICSVGLSGWLGSLSGRSSVDEADSEWNSVRSSVRVSADAGGDAAAEALRDRGESKVSWSDLDPLEA